MVTDGVATAPAAEGAARLLRNLLRRAEIARSAGAYDALSAVLVERAGFDCVWASSFTISASACLPDLSLLTMTDYLQAAAPMVAACSVPVLADCDTGFGGSLNVAHTVRSYERTGVAGICIEDKNFPKTNSFVEHGQELAPVDEFARKIEVAKETQTDPDFVVVARTEALICGRSVDEALERGERYVDAGADALLVHSKRPDPSEITSFLRHWEGRAPVVVVPTTYHGWTAGEASAAGAAMVIYANHALRAAVRAIAETLRRIWEDGCSSEVQPQIASVDEIFELVRLDDWLALDR
jgi:phosphoenolpyruvate phosphomutase